jgi:hypothetical protein
MPVGLLRRADRRWVAAGVATVVALLSVWDSADSTWRRLADDRETYSAYSAGERLAAPANEAGFAGDVFERLALRVGRGDRVYYQVPRVRFGTLDLHDTVAALGRFYLLPAVEATDLDDATVVVSYDADPAGLGRRYLEQHQYGPGIFLSRLARP